jgi:hypothetical protein
MQNTGFLKILPYYKSAVPECQHLILWASKNRKVDFLTRRKSALDRPEIACFLPGIPPVSTYYAFWCRESRSCARGAADGWRRRLRRLTVRRFRFFSAEFPPDMARFMLN